MEEATEAKSKGDLVTAETLYLQVLSEDAGSNEIALRDQEIAVTRLGEMYRDEKYTCSSF